MKNNIYTLDEWFEKWLDIYKKDITGTTRDSYETVYKNISCELGDMILSELKPISFLEVFNDMEEIGYAQSTIKVTRILLNQIMEKAVENELVFKNPVPNIKLNSDNKKKKGLTREEQRKLLNYIIASNHKQKVLIIVLLSTGLRSGEIRALTWQDIDFEKNRIYITKSLREYHIKGKRIVEKAKPKTQKSIRVIPINKELKTCLLEYKENYPKVDTKTYEIFGDLLFSKGGEYIKQDTLTYIFRCISREMEEEGCDIGEIRPHMLRHAFASRCLEAGMSPKFIANILGHESIKTTLDIYTHVNEEYLNEEIQKLEGKELYIEKNEVNDSQ